MSEVVLGQMRHLRPGTDDALIDHVGSNLGCPMTDGTFWTWDFLDLGLMMLSQTMLGTTLDVPGCPRTDGTSRIWDC